MLLTAVLSLDPIGWGAYIAHEPYITKISKSPMNRDKKLGASRAIKPKG